MLNHNNIIIIPAVRGGALAFALAILIVKYYYTHYQSIAFLGTKLVTLEHGPSQV